MSELEISAVYKQLIEEIQGFSSVVVAFSGGVDSALVLKLSVDALGRENTIAVTADSPSLPREALMEAQKIASEIGARHDVIPTQELSIKNYSKNKNNRCFYCKTELYQEVARQYNGNMILNGTNYDDLGEYRPGLKAAKEHHVVSPLAKAKITKKMVRELARYLSLSVWEKPASPCLASRIPYGEEVSVEKLKQIEKAELILKENGFVNFRVRHHGNIARIEAAPEFFPHFADQEFREKIVQEMREIGFLYITLDLQGFQSGSLNQTIKSESS